MYERRCLIERRGNRLEYFQQQRDRHAYYRAKYDRDGQADGRQQQHRSKPDVHEIPDGSTQGNGDNRGCHRCERQVIPDDQRHAADHHDPDGRGR